MAVDAHMATAVGRAAGTAAGRAAMLKLWQSLLCSTRQSYNVCTASDGLREMPHARCAGRPPWSPLAAAPGAQCGAGWHAHYASKVSSSCALPFAVWRSGGRRPAPVFADPTSLLPLCLLALLAAAGHQAQAEQAAPVASGARTPSAAAASTATCRSLVTSLPSLSPNLPAEHAVSKPRQALWQGETLRPAIQAERRNNGGVCGRRCGCVRCDGAAAWRLPAGLLAGPLGGLGGY